MDRHDDPFASRLNRLSITNSLARLIPFVLAEHFNMSDSLSSKIRQKLLSQPSKPGFRARRSRTVAFAVLGTGVTLSLVAYFLISKYERHHNFLEFQRRANHLADILETNFHFPLETLLSLPAFYEASEKVNRDEFKTFVSGALERHSGIYEFDWIPIVQYDQRATMEKEAQQDGQAAKRTELSNYEFTELGLDGQYIAAAPRAEYMPIFYQEPANNSLGLDVASNPKWRRIVAAICDRAELIATDRFVLPELPDGGYAVAIMHPVSKSSKDNPSGRSCDGVVAVVLRLDPIMTDVLASSHLQGVTTRLVDETATGVDQLLFPISDHADQRAAEEARSPTMEWTSDFQFADRNWSFAVAARPDSEWLATDVAWLALAGGLTTSFFAAIVAYLITTVAGLRQRVEEAVQLGQYKLEEKLGEGGMGEVYRARHAMLRRPTAVKLLRPEKSSQEAIVRFEREVQSTSQLTHANTIVIFDYGRTPEDVFYYAMEFLDGIDLARIVQFDGAQEEGRVIHILRQACGSLEEAHQAGLIHRDIKPANIMLCNRGGQPDLVKVLDFGLVKDVVSKENVEVTIEQAVTGTPLYMSPEAAAGGQALDARSDIYALGAVGYFLLVGQPVFESESIVRLLNDHINTTPPAPSDVLGKKVASDLEEAILSCLAKDPTDRPQTAEQLADALVRCADSDGWTRGMARRWWANFTTETTASMEQPGPHGHSTYAADETIDVDLTGP